MTDRNYNLNDAGPGGRVRSTRNSACNGKKSKKQQKMDAD